VSDKRKPLNPAIKISPGGRPYLDKREAVRRVTTHADNNAAQPVGYQRRKCSQCGEDLSFSESDPCDKCSGEAELAQPVDGAGVPELTWRSDKAHEATCEAAERTANIYFDTYHPEVERLTVAISKVVNDTRATQPATAPSDLVSRDAAMRAVCSRCANPDRYGPPVPIEGSQRLFHFQVADNWNTGQCNAQAIKQLPAATPTAVAERARRIACVFAKSLHWMNEAERVRLADVIAAEFTGAVGHNDA
jgi:hypothetical protein